MLVSGCVWPKYFWIIWRLFIIKHLDLSSISLWGHKALRPIFQAFGSFNQRDLSEPAGPFDNQAWARVLHGLNLIENLKHRESVKVPLYEIHKLWLQFFISQSLNPLWHWFHWMHRNFDLRMKTSHYSPCFFQDGRIFTFCILVPELHTLLLICYSYALSRLRRRWHSITTEINVISIEWSTLARRINSLMDNK